MATHSTRDGRGSAEAEASGADPEVMIDRVAALLRARGERMTGPRRAVLRALAEGGGHLGADAVIARVADRDPTVHRASVYRTLDALAALGVVQHVHVGHGVTAYHLADAGGAHLHAQCGRCGDVLDLPGDLLDQVAGTLRAAYGFRLDAGHVALSGLCAACAGAGGPAADAPG